MTAPVEPMTAEEEADMRLWLTSPMGPGAKVGVTAIRSAIATIDALRAIVALHQEAMVAIFDQHDGSSSCVAHDEGQFCCLDLEHVRFSAGKRASIKAARAALGGKP